jgi:23S rRNA pseudouridine1911/1915/1917 synthase
MMSSQNETSGQSASPTRHSLAVSEEQAGARLDKYLTEALADKHVEGDAPSRARMRALVEEGRVTRNGMAVSDLSYRVKQGEEYVVDIPPARAARPEGQAIPLDIIYEDDALIVVMKPAGLVVHPAAGNQDHTLVNALIAHCGASLSGIGGEKRPGIVHRLDKDTSGLMVVAKTDRAHHALSKQFAAHGRDGKLTRSYTALVWGEPKLRSGTIEANIARSTHNRLKMATTKTAGREAITHFEVQDTFGNPVLVSLLECQLETGRTHQIRVHMASIGHPLLGDATYGSGHKTRESKLPDKARTALKALNRQALHAHHLGFEHPISKERMEFDAPPPADLQELLDALDV